MVFQEKHQSKYCIFQIDSDIDRYSLTYAYILQRALGYQLVQKHGTCNSHPSPNGLSVLQSYRHSYF